MQSAGHAALEAVLSQRADQRDQDARARRADRMAQRAGAAVHVDLVVRQLVLLHRRHGDHGEGLVDLVQVDLARASSRSCRTACWIAPTGAVVEPARLLRMRRVADDRGQRLHAELVGRRAAHQHQRRGAVGDRAGVGRRHRAVLAEGGLEQRDLVEVGLERLLVVLDETLVLAGLDGDRHDLPARTSRPGSPSAHASAM